MQKCECMAPGDTHINANLFYLKFTLVWLVGILSKFVSDNYKMVQTYYGGPVNHIHTWLVD